MRKEHNTKKRHIPFSLALILVLPLMFSACGHAKQSSKETSHPQSVTQSRPTKSVSSPKQSGGESGSLEESQEERGDVSTITPVNVSEEKLKWNINEAPNYYKILNNDAIEPKEIPTGKQFYCNLDKLKRSMCAGGNITAQNRKDAQARGRQKIDTLKPSGWGKNPKVTIPATSKGVKDYRGYLYNRSHLLADSLGGEPIVENVVTGLRTQNVGQSDNKGGMAYAEIISRNFLDKASAGQSLYYFVEAKYVGDELIPRATVISMKSFKDGKPDKKIDETVLVYNDANGFPINYNTGAVIK